ncbi:MAG: hypothetical protein QF632_00555 [Candidatus Woesearchaeota archaeon]|jgi:hypothetical protein|nr:hypothetical protein [Candidatus Woesearchaeota archaeon]
MGKKHHHIPEARFDSAIVLIITSIIIFYLFLQANIGQPVAPEEIVGETYSVIGDLTCEDGCLDECSCSTSICFDCYSRCCEIDGG